MLSSHGKWPRTQRRKRRSALRPKPYWLSALYASMLATLLWVGVNGLYQVIRKPTELFFPVSGALNKSPSQAWREYRGEFQRASTADISAEFLAALAQTESTANPIARPDWRWSWSLNPLHVYRPASTAVGMYQMTDGNFYQAKRLCIRAHAVQHDCWKNAFYSRVFPADAIEMTSAYLDTTVSEIIQRRHRHASIEQKENLAALVHLCGPGVGDLYASAFFTLPSAQHCGSENPRRYVARVASYRRVFEELSSNN